MLISRLGAVAKSGRKTTQVTHAAEVGGLVFGGTVETSIEATHAAKVGGLTFGATASPIIEVAMGGEVRGLTFAAEYDDRNLVQHGGVVEGLTFAANVDPVVGVSHAAQVGGLTFAASVDPVVGVTHAANVGGLVFAASVTGIIEDADAAAYLNAVEAADGQTLEPAVRAAINNFVVGCKADGIWTPIKAACILAGARTLNGALVPLVGSAPTNNNFVPADHNRKTGLKGDGSTKWLNTNRLQTAAGRDNQHGAIWVSDTALTGNVDVLAVGSTSTSYFGIGYSATFDDVALRNQGVVSYLSALGTGTNRFIGAQRASTSMTVRYNYENFPQGTSTNANIAQPFTLYAYRGSSSPNTVSRFTNARLSFYSIGEAINFTSLESRVATLMTALNSAIP